IRAYQVADADEGQSLERIARIAARATSSPIAVVSMLDGDRLWFTARHGTSERHVARDIRAHAAAGLHDEPWIEADLGVDAPGAGNSDAGALIVGETGIR
ncbi:hypothetical protein ACOI9R_38580, partial [Mesorhizobium japonicum]